MSAVKERLPVYCLILVLVIALWSYNEPFDRFTWYLEAAPLAVALPLLLLTYNNFRFTALSYVLITLHCIVLLVGAHYTYAQVPLFHWIAELAGYTRNHYDRLGHFMQGAVPAIIIRELLIRTSPLRPGKWLFFIILFSCLGISAVYEIIEWLTAVFTEDGAASFLGTQGDIWDTQKDMMLAGLGAIISQILFIKMHDRQLANLLKKSHYPAQTGRI